VGTTIVVVIIIGVLVLAGVVVLAIWVWDGRRRVELAQRFGPDTNAKILDGAASDAKPDVAADLHIRRFYGHCYRDLAFLRLMQNPLKT
jgi:hypothetical protein